MTVIVIIIASIGRRIVYLKKCEHRQARRPVQAAPMYRWRFRWHGLLHHLGFAEKPWRFGAILIAAFGRLLLALVPLNYSIALMGFIGIAVGAHGFAGSAFT